MSLPDRTQAAEDAFVDTWAGSDDTDGLVAAIEAAMGDTRPQLAARLVGLLGDHVEIEPGSALERAQRAARLFLAHRGRPEDNSWSELQDAWTEVRKSRMRRIRQRQRRSLTGKAPSRIGRLDRRKR